MTKNTKGTAMEIAWKAEGSFPVRFAADAFGEGDSTLVDVLKEVTGSDKPRILLVADQNVVQRTLGLGTKIGRYIQANGIELAAPAVVLGGGEKIKADNMQSAMHIARSTLDAKLGVNDAMLVLGGGTILDVAGYAAAQVRGGVKMVRVPTTIASAMDAAYALTACIDSQNVKDAYRVPCRPSAVVVDPTFSGTVLDGVWRGGFSEAVRHAAVNDGSLMRKIAGSAEAVRNRDAEVVSGLVRAVVESRVKKGTTDFALWSAARLEAMSGYKLPHGYAVAIGICLDTAYAVEKGVLDEDAQETVCRVLADCGALDGLAHSRHIISQVDSLLRGLDALRLFNGSERIVLPSGVGKRTFEEQPDREIYRKVIKEFLSASSED